ncbi:Coiled-coil domain-containing protein 147 [Stylophora pistillata]|uniref:Coiled-coil domain-containing protein 147 n=1 Tax=Stylophora pistillata TaxID=50429 RepID=A0A2B4SIY3_STYPI|nr:Coiled-coil domain-containing protein 147 [Stylophora pistillata]
MDENGLRFNLFESKSLICNKARVISQLKCMIHSHSRNELVKIKDEPAKERDEMLSEIAKALNEKAMKDTDMLKAHLTKVQQDFDQQRLSYDRLATENAQKAAQLKAKEDEINGLKQDTERLTKMGEAIQRKLKTIEDQKMEVEQQKETLKGQVTGLERELESNKKQAEADKKAIDDFVSFTDILNKQIGGCRESSCKSSANYLTKLVNVVEYVLVGPHQSYPI